MDGDRIVSVLVGLAGACGNNPKTADTDSLIIKALAFPVLYPEADGESLAEVLDGLYAEKHAIAPGCAECAFPCGNTSDYDMGRIYGAEEEIREIKLQIISRLRNLAAYVCRCREQGKAAELDGSFLCRAISYIGFDLEKEPLQGLLEEIGDIEKKICGEGTGDGKEDHSDR